MRILIAEKMDMVAEVFRILLGNGFETERAADGEVARSLLASDDSFDVVLCDVQMPRLDGLDLLLWARSERPAIVGRLFFTTAHPEVPTARAVPRTHIHPLLLKPCPRDVLLRAVRAVVMTSKGSTIG